MPLAPARCADCIAFFIARRKATREVKLLGDALGNKLCFHLGVLDLEDVQLNLLAA